MTLRQTRAVHEEIAEILQRIRHGDPSQRELPFSGGPGGFGGGFFSIPEQGAGPAVPAFQE